MSTLEKPLTYRDCKECFASRNANNIIDVIHPNTGRTLHFNKTLEDCRKECPDAEKMTLEEFCKIKAERQRTPIKWEPTTKEIYWEMLEVLPPAVWENGGFMVGEAYDHDAGTGEPRFSAYRHRGDTYETSSRPLTIREFRKHILD